MAYYLRQKKKKGTYRMHGASGSWQRFPTLRDRHEIACRAESLDEFLVKT